MPNRARADKWPSQSSIRTEGFLEEWLVSIVHSVRPRTWHRYAEYVHLHIVPSLGPVPLEVLSPRDIQGLYTEKIAAGLSPRSVLHLHRVLHRALAQAQRWGVISDNAADLVDPPRPETREMQGALSRRGSSLPRCSGWRQVRGPLHAGDNYRDASGRATRLALARCEP
jgi:hypothetical protein